MIEVVLQIPTGSGLVTAIAQVAVVLATLLLVGMLVALGVYAYRHLRGDGIEWPEDRDDPQGNEGVTRGDSDDDWKYY